MFCGLRVTCSLHLLEYLSTIVYLYLSWLLQHLLLLFYWQQYSLKDIFIPYLPNWKSFWMFQVDFTPSITIECLTKYKALANLESPLRVQNSLCHEEWVCVSDLEEQCVEFHVMYENLWNVHEIGISAFVIKLEYSGYSLQATPVTVYQ